MPAPDNVPTMSPDQQQLAREALAKMSGLDTPTTAFLPPTKFAQMLAAEKAPPKPERAPYELGEGEEVDGEHWMSIRRFGAEHPRIEFEHGAASTLDYTVPALPHAVIGPDGSVVLDIGYENAAFVKTNWKALGLQLGEILRTARANYGEDWGK